MRTRGWRGALVIVLLGVTLAANTLTFSAADSLVFHPSPYPDVDRIVILHDGADAPISRPAHAALLQDWTGRRDVFAAVGTFLNKNVFLLGNATERIPTVDVSVGMLAVLGVRPKWGRAFSLADLASEDSYAVVMSEALATKYFGGPERALGQRLDATGRPLVVVGVMDSTFAFQGGKVGMWRLMDPAGPLAALGALQATVIGVVGDFRTQATAMPQPDDTAVYLYALRPEARKAPASEPATELLDNGGSYQFIALAVRMRPPVRTADLLAAARRVDPSLAYRAELVDDRYAAANADTRLTSQVVGAFGLVALIIAIGGLYGVMAFIVTSRSREIGIRAALGADPNSIRRLVLFASTRMALIGALVGTIAAVVTAGAIQSQLFGVSAVDPLTYLGVTAGVLIMAAVATMHAAADAARVSPAASLRAE